MEAFGTISSVSMSREVVGGLAPGWGVRKEETCCLMLSRRKSSAEMLGLMVRDVSTATSSKLVVGVEFGPTKVVVWKGMVSFVEMVADWLSLVTMEGIVRIFAGVFDWRAWSSIGMRPFWKMPAVKPGVMFGETPMGTSTPLTFWVAMVELLKKEVPK